MAQGRKASTKSDREALFKRVSLGQWRLMMEWEILIVSELAITGDVQAEAGQPPPPPGCCRGVTVAGRDPLWRLLMMKRENVDC